MLLSLSFLVAPMFGAINSTIWPSAYAQQPEHDAWPNAQDATAHDDRAQDPLSFQEIEGLLLKRVAVFKSACVASPAQAFEDIMGNEARADLTRINSNTFDKSDSDKLWSYFFNTSVFSLGPSEGASMKVLFFHPWSDTALLTLWTFREDRTEISRLQFVPAEYLRKGGKLPISMSPLWRQLAAHITPVLAVQWGAVQTIEAFEGLPSTVWVPSPTGAEATSEQVEETLSAAAGIQLGQSYGAVAKLLNAPEYEALRKEIDRCAEDIDHGLATCTSPWRQSLDSRTLDYLEPLQGKIDSFSPAGFLTDGTESIVFMTCDSQPSLGLSLSFQKTDAGFQFQRVGYLDVPTVFTQRKEIQAQLPSAVLEEEQP